MNRRTEKAENPGMVNPLIYRLTGQATYTYILLFSRAIASTDNLLWLWCFVFFILVLAFGHMLLAGMQTPAGKRTGESD